MRLAHIGWNLGGLAFPLVIAALVVPRLLENLGPSRFGLLTLAWGIIGYSSVLDLGIGRAVTNRLAAMRNSAGSSELALDTITTAVSVTRRLGAGGALLLASVSIIGGAAFIHAGDVPSLEIMLSATLLSAAIPMQAVSATYRGVNEAYLNFRGISVVRLILGTANFAVPYLISLKTTSLYWVVGSLVAARAIGLIAYEYLARECLTSSGARGRGAYSKAIAKDLFRFGGWFAVSNVLNSCTAVADRFLLAAVISAASVSVYVIPYEIVVQSLVLVGALTTVAFPYFSRLRSIDADRVMPLFYKATTAAIGGMLLVASAFWFLGDSLLSLWLGVEYVPEHATVMRILSIGLAPYAVGTMCVSLLHSYGNTKVTAKINIFEFPVYLILLILMIVQFGVLGAAITWVTRVGINAAILICFALRVR